MSPITVQMERDRRIREVFRQGDRYEVEQLIQEDLASGKKLFRMQDAVTVRSKLKCNTLEMKKNERTLKVSPIKLVLDAKDVW